MIKKIYALLTVFSLTAGSTRSFFSPSFAVRKVPAQLLLAWVLVLTFSQTAKAQQLQSEQLHGSAFGLGCSSDAFAAMDIEYTRTPGFLSAKNLRIYARISIPALLTWKNESFTAWELKAGINSALFAGRKLGAIADIQLFMMHHDQVLGNFFPLGFNLRLTPCCYFAKGYVGLQCNYNRIIATQISHSRYVDNTFTDITDASGREMLLHPRDGWYESTGSHFSIGIENGWKLGSKFFLYGDLGIIKFSSPYTGMFDAMMMGQVPFYGNLKLYYCI